MLRAGCPSLFQADVDHEGLEEAINAAYPKKSAYLGPVGQRLQKGGVKRVESIRSDGSGATFMSSGTQESGGSNGSTTTGMRMYARVCSHGPRSPFTNLSRHLRHLSPFHPSIPATWNP
jgi:hypothetical protein